MMPRRLFHLRPDRFVAGLLIVECLLWLSDLFQCFAKGWAVLVAIASVGMAVLMMVVWFAASLIFHRRFQFSIRSIFVLVLAIAIPSGWLAVERERALRQGEFVERIHKLGGAEWYDWYIGADGDTVPTARQPGPEWLWNLLGGDFFRRIGGLYLSDSKITDSNLDELKGLTRLQFLGLNNTQVTDAGLVRLKGLTSIQILWLGNTKITDAGLDFVKGFTHLRILYLDGTQVTDVGLLRLKELRELQHLGLRGTKITDAGLIHLKGMNQLLGLGLYGTHVTDAGLEQLSGLSQLKWLTFGGSQVTDEGVKKLQQALPNCQVYPGP
jgi:hypothetical protein